MAIAATRALRALVALAALTVSSCGGSTGSDAASQSSAPSSASRAVVHNMDDVMFAQHMIPHHQQAVDMATMVPTRTNNAALQTVAIHIKTDQRAEISLLTDFLHQWGEPLAGHEPMSMDGMVDHDTMSQLESLNGPAFDTLWITAMISHHQGAIRMAEAELVHGQNPDARKMAQTIITMQKREISYMTGLISARE
jgi:uncharacterized protein (DUF305 family)